ncbi:uncharacterized protein LOC122081134 [Macadamia integrifolia]|uniref:uncharacterized protein LOC122081134 n=1 Tax=Macadamia integrifolia TaxID=60698 RepID=UPI001C4E6948|nr:uncharacterized protein LOC122081134 [Macadamia integrifolia]
MVPLEDREQFTAEMVEYRMRNPNLFNITGKSLMKTNHPRIWWEYMSGYLPVVQKVACRILSKPCSSSPCERNWSAWDAAQTKKRNRLTLEMLEDLVYIRMNSLMKEKYENRAIQDTKPIDLEKLGDLPDVNIELETERLEETC